MRTIDPGERASEVLPAGSELSVSVTSGSAVVSRSFGGDVVENKRLSASTVFGPYANDMAFSMACLSGLVVTSIGRSSGTLAPLTPAQMQAILRPNRNRVVVFGDSRAAQNYASGPSASDGEYLQVQGAVTRANAYAGQRMDIVGYMGVGGETTLQNVERMVADLGPLEFDWLVYESDINGVAEGTITAADNIANYKTIYEFARSKGARVIHIGPYAPANALASGPSQVLLQTRDWIVRAPSIYQHVAVIDAMALFGDASTSPPTTPVSLIADAGGSGYHYNGAGAGILGREIARIWCAVVPLVNTLVASAADNYGVDATTDQVNLLDYGVMSGSAGTKGTGATNATAWVTATVYAAGRLVLNGGNAYYTRSGGTSGATAPTHVGAAKRDEFGFLYWDPVAVSDGGVVWEFVGPSAVAGVADGWNVARSSGSGTAYCAVVARADGIGSDIVLGIAGAGATDQYQVNQITSPSSRAVNGRAYVAECEVAVLGASGLCAPTYRLLWTVSGTSMQVRSIAFSAVAHDALWPDCVVTHRTPPVFSATGTITGCNPHFFPQFGAAAAYACLKLGRASLRSLPRPADIARKTLYPLSRG